MPTNDRPRKNDPMDRLGRLRDDLESGAERGTQKPRSSPEARRQDRFRVVRVVGGTILARPFQDAGTLTCQSTLPTLDQRGNSASILARG